MRLNVKAMAITAAIFWGVLMFLVGLLNLKWAGYGQGLLDCMSTLYPGYKASGGIGDVFVGTAYALLDGAIAGAIFAWLYNIFAGMCGKSTTTD
ncbi:MAG: bacteriophage holin [Planctomycetota bacterium]|jgi:hypothetical protein